MAKTPYLTDLNERISFFSMLMICIFIDTIFLCIWVAIHWGVNKLVVVKLVLTGIDIYFVFSLQIIFGIATLIPILLYIYVDLRMFYLRGRKKVREVELE